MALWGNKDRANNAPKFEICADSQFANTGTNLYGTKVMGVDSTEQNVAANPKGGHAGWVKITTGTGGRAGRKHVETLVAMGSMTGDGDVGDPVANDDVIFADA